MLKQLHKLQKKAAPLIISGLLTVFLTESLLQVHYRTKNDRWLWERQVSSFSIPYAEKVADRRQYSLRPKFQDLEAGITIDRHGFRVVPDSPSSAKMQIVNLGDSVPYGVGVRDEQTYPSKLQTLLAKKINEPIAVVNAGVPSYNMRQSLDRFKLDVLKNYKNPRVVTIQAANDVSLLSWYREKWNSDLTWASIRFNILPEDHNLATIFYIQRVYGNLVAYPAPPQTTRKQYEKYPSSKMLDAVKSELADFIRFCQNREITVILMPVDPFYYQTENTEKNPTLPFYDKNKLYFEAWKQIIEDYNNMLVEVSNNSGVYFLDTRKIMDREDRSKMYVDFIHYSPAGNQKVAKAIFKAIEEKGLLTSK